MKTCINCGKEKELDKYYFIKNTGKYKNTCKDCMKKKSMERYNKKKKLQEKEYKDEDKYFIKQESGNKKYYYPRKNTPTENYIRQSKIIKHLKKNHNLSDENNVQGLKIKDWKIKSHNQEIIKL